MKKKPVIRIDPIDVANDLQALGIPYDILKQAILAGEYERDKCTLLDPPNAPGFIAWAKTLRRLKELLIPLGWLPTDYTIVRPDGHMAIIVAMGDELTGDHFETPKTKYPKGGTTQFAVSKNNEQLELFRKVLKKSILDNPQNDAVQTWMLLRNRVDDTVLCELSFPSTIGDDNRIVDWGFRIVLTPITMKPDPTPDQGDEGDDFIEAKVERR